ncbi:hypothetical protein G7K_6153-t1 [Saitoella complicata NRRL Y-17804]|uniref:Uncharacterized protein n=1 Tax=Saitoella complicata (strain BCRC 22490 / CBS 7301 / JCM 7358 / NBRC 10748 / NRRL Y-17804) TaxID=698492 RepID=A0A0E9NQB4_SAICN|nr:hypothetical protein G7K_6153-t1 [Saitoella complicata NRRL Y-17804]
MYPVSSPVATQEQSAGEASCLPFPNCYLTHLDSAPSKLISALADDFRWDAYSQSQLGLPSQGEHEVDRINHQLRRSLEETLSQGVLPADLNLAIGRSSFAPLNSTCLPDLSAHSFRR